MPPSYINFARKVNDVFRVFDDGDFSMKHLKVDTKRKKENGLNINAGESTLVARISDTLEFGFGTSYNPLTAGKKCLKSSYANDLVALNCDVDLDREDCILPLIHSSATFGYEKWICGTAISYDMSQLKLTRSDLEIGYRGGEDLEFTGEIHPNYKEPEEKGEEIPGTEFAGSLQLKVTENVEAATSLRWSCGSGLPVFSLGAKCSFDEDEKHSLRFKVNTLRHVGVAYTGRLVPGVNVTMSCLVDTHNIKDIHHEGHKFRFGLEIEDTVAETPKKETEDAKKDTQDGKKETHNALKETQQAKI